MTTGALMLEAGLEKTPLLPPPDIGWDAFLTALPRIDLQTELVGKFPVLRELFYETRKRPKENASEENLLPGNGVKRKKNWMGKTPPPQPVKRRKTEPQLGPTAAELRARCSAKSPQFRQSFQRKSPPPKTKPTAARSPRGKKSPQKQPKLSKKTPKNDPFNSPHMDIFMGLLRNVDARKQVPAPMS